MQFLTRHFGPLPAWAYIVIAVIGGVAIYIWYRHNSSSSSSGGSSSSSNAATNPLNPDNDPNIDPNTGVPYALEEAIDPNTGEPYYYSNTTPSTTPSAPPPPNPPTQQQSSPPPPPPTPTTLQGHPLIHPYPAQRVTSAKGSGPDSNSRNTFVFEPIGNTGQTAPLSSVAIQEYGVHTTSRINAAVQDMINANPSLRGRGGNYQPPVGTKIVLPKI